MYELKILPKSRILVSTIIFVSLFVQISCSSPVQSRGDIDWPLYGIWESESGYSIEVTEEDIYYVCFGDQCDSGLVDSNLLRGPLLLDFISPDKPISERLVMQSGYYDLLTLGGSQDLDSRDIQFGINVGPDIRERDCGGNPCFVMRGREYSGRNPFAFVLKGE